MLNTLHLVFTRAKSRTCIWVLILLLFTAIVHHTWLNPTNLFTHTDWFNLPNQAVKELWFSYGTWINSFNFGSPNIQINFYGFYGLWSGLLHVGISYTIGVWLTYLLPISILSVISPFMLVKKLHDSNELSFVCALFYSTVIYFLARQSSHLAMVFIFSISPLIFYLLIKAFETNKFTDWLKFTLMLWVSSVYELRVTYILAVILIAYALVFHYKRIFCNYQYLKNLIIVALLFIVLSLYWLLPTIFGGIGSSVSAVANTGVFGDALFDLRHALAISDSSWTGSKPNEVFIPQTVKIYVYFLPFITFLPLYILKSYKKNEQKLIVFFSIAAMFGIFLTKQSAPPVTFLYEYMYKHIPGFNLYREASKFYLITGISYLFLISFSLLGLARKFNKGKQKYIASAVGCLIIIVACVNVVPFIRNNFSGMVTPRHIPTSYSLFNKYIDTQDEYSRTAWLPTASRWATYSNLHPRVNLNSVMGNEWKDYVSDEEAKYPSYKQAMVLMKKPYAQTLFASSSIKYVVIPTRDEANDDDFIRQFGDDRSTFIDNLSELPWLKRVYGFNDLTVFVNAAFNPYIFTSNTLTGVNNYRNFSSDYSLAKNNSANASNYTDKKDIPTTQRLFDLSTILNRNSIKNGKLNFTVANKSGLNFITINNQLNQYNYSLIDNLFTLTRQSPASFKIDNQINIVDDSKTVIQSTQAKDNDYYISVDSGLYAISKNNSSHDLGLNKSTPLLLKATSGNLITNGSFESGLWQINVTDCNNYDNQPKISMFNVPATLFGGHAVELNSFYHTACTYHSGIPVRPGPNLIHFAYSAQETNSVRYRLSFNDSQKTIINKTVEVNDDTWKLYTAKFDAPEGATALTLTIYGNPDPKLQKTSTTQYTQFIIKSLATLPSDIKLSDNPQQDIALTAHDNNISISRSELKLDNIIINPSLEQGLWQKKVGDCNAYDDKPLLAMAASTKFSTDGNKSLELSARSHIACTGPMAVKVSENSNYFLAFDYKSFNGSQAGYSIAYNDENRTRTSGILPIADANWHTLNKIIVAPYGATTATVTFYSYSKVLSNTTVINYYDNVYLGRIPSIVGRYYYVNKAESTYLSPEVGQIVQHNPTYKSFNATNAFTSFYLYSSEAFNDRWSLAIKDMNGKAIPVASKYHFKSNAYQNGWYIDTKLLCSGTGSCVKNLDGSYNIRFVVTYSPQRYFYIGIAIGSVALMLSLTYLITNSIIGTAKLKKYLKYATK